MVQHEHERLQEDIVLCKVLLAELAVAGKVGHHTNCFDLDLLVFCCKHEVFGVKSYEDLRALLRSE